MLGGLSPSLFLRRHWQKQPLLVRSALADVSNLVTLRQLLSLARHDACEARLVIASAEGQEVIYGPISPSIFRDLPERNWTVLVQGVNHVLPGARDLLRRFSFLPQARLDDVMVSYAAPGGGVGPHFDSYDVFLLQGSGKRQWEVSAQTDLELLPDTDLKILKHFRPEGSSVLESGDMLYLPPRFAHNGVALEACFTYSVGFRAPAHEELKSGFLSYLDDEIDLTGRYEDPDLTPCRHFGEIRADMIRRVTAVLSRIRWQQPDIVLFLGRYLSEPKPNIVLPKPTKLTYPNFVRRVRADGIEVHPALPLLFHGRLVFINGEAFEMKSGERASLVALADSRRLPAKALRADGGALRILHTWYCDGYITTGEWGRM